VFTTNFNSTLAQAKTITATINGVVITQTAAVTVTAATAASIAVSAGNAQTARVGLTVATSPQVVVDDAFGNNVTGATVTFTASSGGGSVSGGSQVTSNGFASVGSWTLGGSNADNASGLMSNTLSASVTPCSGTCSTSFSASAFYGWAAHVAPVIGSTGTKCASCHANAPFNRNPNNIVGVTGSTGTACTSFTRVVAFSAATSSLYTKAAGSPNCGVSMPTSGTALTVQELKQLRAWINNGAQLN
jgi:hypothetical protein